jgi:hypothetical protein
MDEKAKISRESWSPTQSLKTLDIRVCGCLGKSRKVMMDEPLVWKRKKNLVECGINNG